ncbi:MAG: nicotinate (nicotinamide) nucleotide adenylyltransferase [Nitrospirae bacterium]|nr:nicotinate (nicotinamide) nucleotide adenylyltransferase [Nitrospirota bacterium]
MKPLRIAVFGGTFDPVHFGHLRSIQEVQDRMRFDKVFIIPNRRPPHKSDRHPAPFNHRLSMLRLALGRNAVIQVSDIEGRRGGPSFTVETLRQLQASRVGARLFLILGVDSFAEIGTWKRFREVLDDCDIVVMERPGRKERKGASWIPLEVRRLYGYDAAKGVYRNKANKTLALVRVTPFDVSASAVRQAVKEGRSIRFLTPPAVERYIQEHRLYR